MKYTPCSTRCTRFLLCQKQDEEHLFVIQNCEVQNQSFKIMNATTEPKKPALENDPMKKILAYMDFLCPTGFGTVSINLMQRMDSFFKEKNIKVDLVALNF